MGAAELLLELVEGEELLGLVEGEELLGLVEGELADGLVVAGLLALLGAVAAEMSLVEVW
ncbi:hypothetical protein [Friedmanniella luteola]|uniref:hypothetical protein n=1 Tax=Friedmanniella luteola TaxID=546871 RepID=UPI001E39A65A|nr:hypothetical protein [Friedmanniella luteola]